MFKVGLNIITKMFNLSYNMNYRYCLNISTTKCPILVNFGVKKSEGTCPFPSFSVAVGVTHHSS